MFEHFDWNTILHSLFLFLATYFGSKHGTQNGK